MKPMTKCFDDDNESSALEDGHDEALDENHEAAAEVEEKSVQTKSVPAASNIDKNAVTKKSHAHHDCCCIVDHAGDGGQSHITGSSTGAPGSSCTPVIDLKQLAMLNFGSSTAATSARTLEEAKHRKYKFWETQPVAQFTEKVFESTVIELDKATKDIRQESYSLPDGFLWKNIDINDDLELQELYQLLNENYVEDDDNMFRFDYSPEFLRWALQPPGWKEDWHCGVRALKSGKLIGFISAIPAKIKIYDREVPMVEINFLCVHKKLRSKRVAPVLIREITRRVNLCGIFQAVYTAGVILPRPVCTSRYWHRSLNPKKLIDVKFSHLSKNMTLPRTLKLYKLPPDFKTAGFRPLSKSDIVQVHSLLASYLNKFDMAPVYDAEECAHWLLPRDNVVDTYVVEKNGEITDMASFYTLPSTVVNHPVHKSLKAAYLFYNVSTTTPLSDLINDLLIAAKNKSYDVFNALDLMDNKQFLEKLKFGIGDGNLQYYLYNWKCPDMQPEQVGLVLQ